MTFLINRGKVIFTFLLTLLLFTGTVQAKTMRETDDDKSKVSLQLNNVTLKQVLDEIHRQTGVNFVYNQNDISQRNIPKVEYRNVSVAQLLDDLLPKQQLAYKMVGNSISIHKAQTLPKDVQQKMQNMKIAVGKVVDDKGEPLPGVTVQIKGSVIGTSTDSDGAFKLNVPEQSELVFTFVGMRTQTVGFNNQKEIKVTLLEDVTEIEEVVVTGIFNKPRESYTGAVTTITEKELKMFKGANTLQTLRNIDPAFNIVQNNAMGSNPNALPEVNLRGSSSLPKSVNALNQGAQAQLNAPLVIMDGFEVSLQKLMDFNDEDIESVNILKDASATAIYGSRGANGVIVITTKAPEAGNLKLRVNGGINLEIPDLTSYDLLNAAEKLEFERGMGFYKSGNNAENLRLQKLYNHLLLELQNGVDTYWLSQPLQTGIGQNYNLNLDGGSKEFRWAVSLGYRQTIGVMKGSKRDNFDGSVTLTYNMKKFLFRNQTRVSSNVGTESKYGSFSDYVGMNPYWRPYDENGEPVKKYQTANNVIVSNPLYNASLNAFQNNKQTQIIDNFSVEWTPVAGFQVKGRLGFSKSFNESNRYRPGKHTFFDNYDGEDYFRKGDYNLSVGQGWGWDGNFTISYTKAFHEKHQVYVGLDASAGQNTSYSYNIIAEGFNNENFDFFGRGASYQNKPGGSESTSRRVGFTGTINYTYDNRYFADGSIRMDGASTFGGKNKFAPFWSVGVGWNIHKEKFITNTDLFSNIRLRASYGQNGSQQFSAYEALTSYDFYLNDRYMLWNGSRLKGHANDDLKWQTTNQANLGLELGFFANRISFKFDVYNKKTVDLLSTINIPTSTGFPTYTANIGTVKNTGFEGKISGYIIRDTERELMWSLTGTIVHNKNKILKLSDAIKRQTEEAVKKDNDQALLYEGESTTGIYAVPSLGVDPSTGNEIFLDKDGNPTYTWHADSRRLAGNSEPDYRGNISTMVTWKNLSLNLSFAYQWGGQQYNRTLKDRVEISIDKAYNNVDRRVYEDRWMKPGDHSFYPKFSYSTTKSSSRFVQNDNVFTLQSVALNYRNTGKWLKHLKIESFNIAINASDIFYISTIRRERGTSYPFARHATMTFGLQF